MNTERSGWTPREWVYQKDHTGERYKRLRTPLQYAAYYAYLSVTLNSPSTPREYWRIVLSVIGDWRSERQSSLNPRKTP